MIARISLLLIASTAATFGGQMRRGHSARPTFQRFPTDAGLPPVLPIPPLISTPAHRPLFRAPEFFRFAPVYSGYPAYPPASVSNVVVIQAAPAQPPPSIPPQPPRPQLRDYTWPAPTRAASRCFSVALLDGSVYCAQLVWQHGQSLFFVTPEGERREVPLQEVDRAATERLNREKNLTFPWP